MDNQVQETGMERYHRLKAEAKELGITGNHSADDFESLIDRVKAGSLVSSDSMETPKEDGLTTEEAKKIETRLRLEEEIREKFRRERQIKLDRASLVADSEAAGIKIDLPDNPTEIELARARTKLGIEKLEVKPSPETVGIEAGKRGYYVFTNREQDDASHTVNLGGKYIIHLIPDQIHVLSDFHIKTWRKRAVVPNYERVPTGSTVEGQMGEECKRVGGKPRFSFEYLGEAPPDAKFGMVTDTKILDGLKQLT